MICPYCTKEMTKSVITGNGRSKVFWEPENKKLDMLDRLCGIGMIEAKYSFGKFTIQADYCEACKKMIFSTGVSNSIIN